VNLLRFKNSIRLLAMDGLMLRMQGCIRAALAMDGLMLRMQGCIRVSILEKYPRLWTGTS